MSDAKFLHAVELLNVDARLGKVHLISENLAAMDFGYFYYFEGSSGPVIVIQVDVRSGPEVPFIIGNRLASLSIDFHMGWILIENSNRKIRIHNIEALDIAAIPDSSPFDSSSLDLVGSMSCIDDSDRAVAYSSFLEKNGIPDWMPEAEE